MRLSGWTLVRVAPLLVVAGLLWYWAEQRSAPPPASSEAQLQVQTGAVAPQAAQQSDAGVDTLLRQLQLAEVMGRLDLLESNLRRLEAIAPRHPDALFYRAYLQMSGGRGDAARSTLQRLRQQAPDSPRSLQLASYLDSLTVNSDALQQARLLAAAGRYEEALAAYRQVFPHGMPTLRLQLDYLDIQGRLSPRWAQTRQALAALNAQYPDFPVLALALAEHISRRYPGDAQALATYRRLADGPGLGRQAAAAWLRALARRPINASTLEGYALLARRYPSDLDIQENYRRALTEVAEEKQRLKNPHYRAKQEGLAQLEAGSLSRAESRLRYALQGRSDDEEVLGGLGMVYLRRGEQARALPWFRRALANNRNPDLRSKWQGLVDTASYWSWVKEAEVAIEQGRFDNAQALLDRAIALQPDNPRAYIVMGDLALTRGELDLADGHYRQALNVDPSNASALWARVALQERRYGRRAALAFIDSLPAPQQRQIADRRQQMQAQQRQAALQVAMQDGDRVALRRAIDEALSPLPSSPWQRAEIADALLLLDEEARADDLMAEWTDTSPSAEMRFAYALYLSRRGQAQAAIAQLEAVPASQRSDAMANNLLRLRLAGELGEIGSAHRAQPAATEAKLRQLASRYAADADALLGIADIWLDLERPRPAAEIVDTLHVQQSWSFATRYRYGELLLRLDRLKAFGLWQASYPSQGLDEDERQQLQQQRARYQLARARDFEAKQQYLVAYSMYHQAAEVAGPEQFDARLGVLRSSRHIEERESYQAQLDAIFAQQEALSPAQLLALAELLTELGDDTQRDRSLALLAQRSDTSAIQMRDAMLLAEQAGQWQRAEGFAHLALAREDGENLSLGDVDSALSAAETQAAKARYQGAADNWLTRSAKSALDRYRDRRDGHIVIGLDYSVREGREETAMVPIEARIPVPSLDGHLLLRMDYVSLDAGDVDYLDPRPAPDNPGATVVDRIGFSEQASGYAVGIGWQADKWWADIGSTPLGLRQHSWVGGVGLRGALGQVGWRLNASRRAEVGTTLSYGGMEVPDTAMTGAGRDWGGVLRSGVKLGLSYDRGGALGYWSSLQYHQLSGRGVADNQRLGVLGGVYWRVLAEEDRNVRLGLNLLHLQYDKNLEEFTLGHGGYYSPQQYFSLSLPLRYYGRRGSTWSYMLGASVSRSVTEEDAPYRLGGSDGSGGGFGYALEAAVEKRIGKRWYLGLAADIQRADFYEPNHVLLYLRYTFQDRWQPIHTPPEPPIPYSSFD